MKRALAASIAALAVLTTVSCGDGGQQSYDWGWHGDALSDTVTGTDLAESNDAARDVGDPDDMAGDDLMLQDISGDSGTGDDAGDTGGEDTASPADSVDPDAIQTTDVSDDPTVGGFDLTGTWARLHVSSRMSKPAIGDPKASPTTSILLVKITYESGRFFMESDLCSLTLGQTSTLVTTVVPQAFTDSIATVKREFTLVESDGTVQFTEPEHVDLYGVNLANPQTDPLPDMADDPAVWDQDEDGHPGMTIQISGIIQGDFYLIQRTISSMTGPVEADDRFDGLVASATEQVYLGTSNETLMNFIPETYADTDPSHSYYRHTRIDSSWGCAEIVENQDDLFAR